MVLVVKGFGIKKTLTLRNHMQRKLVNRLNCIGRKRLLVSNYFENVLMCGKRSEIV